MDDGHYLTELILRETEADVTRVYRQAVDEITKKLDEYLRKFKVKDLIKQEQLRKGEITQAEYNYWKTGQIAIGKRWEEMKNTLAQDLHNANDIARSVINGHIPEVYAVNHNYATFQVEKESLVDTSYTLYDRQTVERLIRDQPDVLPEPGARMREKLAANKDLAWQRGQIQSVMTQSILQGESIPNMAKRICNTLGEKNRKAAVRYARTAATGVQNAGRVDAYKRAEDMGIELEQEWLATLDGRTRHEHRYLDGQHVPVGKPFTVDGYELRFPGDPTGPGYLIWNCRCTLIPRLKNLDQSDAPRKSKLGNMSYDEWKHEHDKPMEVSIPGVQGEIGRATSVQEVNDIINRQDWWGGTRVPGKLLEDEYGQLIPDPKTGGLMRGPDEIIPTYADLTGVDLESAKSIASSYQRVFDRYPQLKGKFNAPNAQPVGMDNNTYAWCYTTTGGQVQVNPKRYNNWSKIFESYESDVASGWHPKGTTAESIIIHELGHAVDGLLAEQKILGGFTSSGEYRLASSSLKQTIMNRAAKIDPDIADDMDFDRRFKANLAVRHHVSRYATKNGKEWFAECFAEYLTSADPRVVATEFGKELEKLLERIV